MTDTILNSGELGVLDLDFTGVAESRLIPEGVYPARIEKAEVRNSAASGKPALYLSFELLGPERFMGRHMPHVISLQESARGLIQALLIGLGYPREDLQGKVKMRPESLIERTCGIRVGYNTYEGEQRNRIFRIVPFGDVAPEMLTAPEAPFGGPGEAEEKEVF